MSRLLTIAGFHSAALQNTRSLRVYLPPSYAREVEKRYPVLYMHDGQNLFSNDTAFAGAAWNVHQAVDRLVVNGEIQEVIIVGVDNSPNRFSEYAYQSTTLDGIGYVDGKGHLYAQFLRDEVIPYIDGNFRTLPSPEHRAVMGSSMGGLISLQLALHNPDIFSMAGCLSSAFRWADNAALRMLRERTYAAAAHPKLWLDLGDSEEAPIKESREIAYELLQQDWIWGEDLAYYEVPGGGHFETDWARRVHMPLLFFFGRIGEPTSLALAGHHKVGMTGLSSWLNPMVSFERNVQLTDLTATARSDEPETLDMGSMGQLKPVQTGQCRITASSHGLEAAQTFTVVAERSPMVNVDLTLHVPDEIPTDETVYLGLVTKPDFLPLEKVATNQYRLQTEIPRDWKIVFAFTRGSRETMEVFDNGDGSRYRELLAADNMEITLTVKRWADFPESS